MPSTSGVQIARVDWFGHEVSTLARSRVLTGDHRREADELLGYAHDRVTEVSGNAGAVVEVHDLVSFFSSFFSVGSRNKFPKC